VFAGLNQRLIDCRKKETEEHLSVSFGAAFRRRRQVVAKLFPKTIDGATMSIEKQGTKR
jgi:hypothetical protein